MEQEEKEYSLVPVLDAKTNKYYIKDFENIKENINEYIRLNVHDVEITDKEQNKAYKDVRAFLNKNLENVARARIDITKLLTQEFECQCKELEAIIGEAEKTLKKHIDDWTAKNRVVVEKIPTKTLTIKVNETAEEMKKLAKVQAFAEKLGLKVVVK